MLVSGVIYTENDSKPLDWRFTLGSQLPRGWTMICLFSPGYQAVIYRGVNGEEFPVEIHTVEGSQLPYTPIYYHSFVAYSVFSAVQQVRKEIS